MSAEGGGVTAPPRRLSPRRATAFRDIGGVAVAAIPAFVFVFLALSGTWEQRCFTAAVEAVVWGVCVGAARALGGAALTALGPRVAVGRGVLVAVIASTAVAVWLPHDRPLALRMLVLGAIVFAGGAVWETFALRYIAPTVRLLLVGTSGAAETLIHDIRRGRAGGFELVGVVAAPGSPPSGAADVHVLGSVDELDGLIAEHRPDLVVLTPGPRSPETFLRLLDAADAGFRVLELAEFYEYAFGRVPLEDLPHEWFLSVLHLYRRPYSRVAKRTIDVLGAAILTLLTLPLYPLLALVCWAGGPVIHRQVRLGEHGKLFTIYKFRTMRVDAEADGQAVWAEKDDRRVTAAGAWMRRLRLDELPQLWNVLRGDMSLVGPRPERPEFLAELSRSVPFWSRRHLVKPGLTGWAQVRQGYVNSADATATKLSFDLWYLRHRSLTVDLAILLRTVFAVVRGDRPAVRSAPRAQQPAIEAAEPDPAG